MLITNETMGSKKANMTLACSVKLIGDSDTEV